MADEGLGKNRGWVRIVILLAVVFAVAGVLALKDQGESSDGIPVAEPGIGSAEGPAAAPETGKLPRMVDLGADKCIPCKTMAPILAKLKTDLAGQCEILFVDVWKNPKEGPKYGIKVIPTQVFFGPDGQEFSRHEGFFSRKDILAVFAEHGYTFKEI